MQESNHLAVTVIVYDVIVRGERLQLDDADADRSVDNKSDKVNIYTEVAPKGKSWQTS